MHKFLYLVFALAFTACETTNQATMNSTTSGAAADDKDWISLFDGKTTNGWHTYGKTTIGKAWKVVDGSLHLDAASKKTGKLPKAETSSVTGSLKIFI